MALVELRRFANSFEAGLARSSLAAAGIHSFLFDTEMSWVGGDLVSIRLMVDEDEREDADALLSEDGAESG